MIELNGKKIEIFVEGINAKLSGVVMVQDDFEIILQTGDSGIYHIPLNKIGPYKVLNEKALNELINYSKFPVYIYMCQNILGCKGVKMLSTDIDLKFDSIPCKCNKKQLECQFSKLGCAWDLPTEVLVAFMNGMCTQGFPIEEDKQKGKK